MPRNFMKIEKCKLWAHSLPLFLPPTPRHFTRGGKGKLEYFLTHFYRWNCQRVKSGQRGVRATCLRLQHLTLPAAASAPALLTVHIDMLRYICIHIYILYMGYTYVLPRHDKEIWARQQLSHGEIEKNCLSIWEKCVAKQIVAVSS